MCHTKKSIMIILTIFSILYLSDIAKSDIPCATRNENYDSVVCVCNATYCDEISKIVVLPKKHYILYSTTKGGLRFRKSEGTLLKYNADVPDPNPRKETLVKVFAFVETQDTVLKINRKITHQTIKGFGGGFSDAAAINYMKLSPNTRENLIKSYFSENGIEYTMGRVPIAGSDFSTRPYAYNMYPENDVHLRNFSLTEEDYSFKIPFIKDARKAATNELKLIAAAWSPPIWMKTSRNIGGKGFLLEKYYQTWANYHIKFLKAYDKANVTFWAVSTGNEPVNGLFDILTFNTLGWLPHQHSRWIADNFGPTIRKSKYNKTKIITLDDQRLFLEAWVLSLKYYKNAFDFIDGFGVHWYTNMIVSNFVTDIANSQIGDKFIIGAESAIGHHHQFLIEYGSWERAEWYLRNIIDDLNHKYVAWIDWNLMLDINGGPNWNLNFNDALVIVDPEKDEFIKQATFYAMGHFSKFIPRGSVRIDVQLVSGPHIKNVAFKRPDGGITVVIYNDQNRSRRVIVKEKGNGKLILFVPAQSVHTFVYF